MKHAYTRKARLILLGVLFLMVSQIKAQNYVTIPDSNFVKYLQDKFSTCMNGNQMDTSCISIKTAIDLDIVNLSIKDLTGAQYFRNLAYLRCEDNLIENIPVLNCSKLKSFTCQNNKLTSIPPINAPQLTQFFCYNNQLTALPALNCLELEWIECQHNSLTTLPVFNLPKLTRLIFNNNHIKDLPVLNLPSLTQFDCDSNEVTELVNLNAPKLSGLGCNKNALTTISIVKYPKLSYLRCSGNALTSLPPLPVGLGYLHCADNLLTELPPLPFGLCELICSNNKLTELPPLPRFLNCKLDCANNKINCFPLFPDSLGRINLTGNPFTCLPNYTEGMDINLHNYPLCKDGDLVNNPNQCIHEAEISGMAFKDNDNNCKVSGGDDRYLSVPIQWYDDKNNLMGKTFSVWDIYQIKVPSNGQYKVQIDTVGMPYRTSCPAEQFVDLKNGASGKDINFGVNCKPGIDLGIQGIRHSGRAFPGQKHELIVIADEMNKLYNMRNCAVGASGQVKVTVNGPVTYAGIPSGALTPSISGNVFTYTITDFNVDLRQAFRLSFITNTTATISDTICIHAQVTLNGTDVNSTNNNNNYCYAVVNSHDPNIKEVYPLNEVEEDYKGWFTYTIHFQNTGNAPAYFVRLADTLDADLDLKTLQVIGFSHYNQTALIGNALDVQFPWINLADSLSDPEASKGFIQYRVKPKEHLKEGITILNKAYIYFDYNAPVITNTTINKYVKTVSVDENEKNVRIQIYPNPSNGLYFIEFSEDVEKEDLTVEIYNVLGSIVYRGKTSVHLTSVDLSHQPKGVYFIKIKGVNQSYIKHLIKQ
jgi:hypothetical protein